MQSILTSLKLRSLVWVPVLDWAQIARSLALRLTTSCLRHKCV